MIIIIITMDPKGEFMNKDELIAYLKEAIKNAKTVEDLKGVLFTMLESQMNPNDMLEILEEIRLSEEVLKEISEEEPLIKK